MARQQCQDVSERKIKDHYALFLAATEETPGSRKLLVLVWYYFVFVFKSGLAIKVLKCFTLIIFFLGSKLAVCSQIFKSQINQNSDQKTVSIGSRPVNDLGFAENVCLRCSLLTLSLVSAMGKQPQVRLNKISMVSPLKRVPVKTPTWLDLAWGPQFTNSSAFRASLASILLTFGRSASQLLLCPPAWVPD